jgi:hypothetical protein
VVECLLSKCEALSLKISTTKKKKNPKGFTNEEFQKGEQEAPKKPK